MSQKLMIRTTTEPAERYHPHVHVLLTDGGFAPDGTFRPLAWFDSQHVERLFRAEVLRMLLGRELITEAIVDNLLSRIDPTASPFHSTT